MSAFKPRALVAVAAMAGALGLGAAAAHAQTTDGAGPFAGQVTVSPPLGRAWDGAPIEMVRATRVVPTYDLDLNTAWGRYELRGRIERAAVDACQEVGSAWTQGLFPTGQDGNCVGRTVRRALWQVYRGA